jgi:hypothetical protein
MAVANTPLAPPIIYCPIYILHSVPCPLYYFIILGAPLSACPQPPPLITTYRLKIPKTRVMTVIKKSNAFGPALTAMTLPSRAPQELIWAPPHGPTLDL